MRPVHHAWYFNSRPHGGRLLCVADILQVPYFNSRPHGGRQRKDLFRRGKGRFQLTPSRRATLDQKKELDRKFISTHALTEGDHIHSVQYITLGISTHALTEGDFPVYSNLAQPINFNSRPHGGRRCSLCFSACIDFISTHALTEGDLRSVSSSTTSRNFNSRPHGGRLHR